MATTEAAPRPAPRRRRRIRVAATVLLGGGVLVGGCSQIMFSMPGSSHRGPLPPLTAEQAASRDRLRAHVRALAGDIGPRNVFDRRGLDAAERYLDGQFRGLGYEPRREEFLADGDPVANLEATLPGGARAGEVVLVGAHYDSVPGCPAANDNASGTAALLEIARTLRGRAFPRTIRLVAFVNEEPPHFQTEAMGSLVHARGCRKRGEDIRAMLSLETIGCYSDEPGSQKYPPPLGLFYPGTGNFIAFVGNLGSRDLVRRCTGVFRRTTPFPSVGGAIPGWIPGIGWSDHWSFWQEGYPGVMVTDTAPFRDPRYHRNGDTPEKLDYGRMARVVTGVMRVIEDLAREE